MNATLRLRPRGLAAAAIAASAVAAFPAGAAAADPQPATDPAVAQYVEMVPTFSGSVASGRGTGAAKVPAATERQIEKEGGTNAELLTKVVTSEAYGAPTEYQAPAAQSETTSAPPAEPAATEPAATVPAAKKKPAAKQPPAQPQPAAPAAREPLPPAPSPVSAAIGSPGVGGVLFVIALACAVGLGVTSRLARGRQR